MDIDEEILQRLADLEDHFTERKETPQEHRIREIVVAFANSAIAGKPGIIYIGVTDKGKIKGGANDSWLHKVTSWANSCFPEVNIIQRILDVEGQKVHAVAVPASDLKPHFAKAAYKRVGSSTLVASQEEIDSWIAYRNSKVRHILDARGPGKAVTVRILKQGVKGSIFIPAGNDFEVVDCNTHWVTLFQKSSSVTVTHPLNFIELKMDDEKHQLMLLLRPYY